MMEDDPDLEKLSHLPGVKDLIENFRTNFKTTSEEYLKGPMDKNDVRNKEIGVFDTTVMKIRLGMTESTFIDAFTKSNKEVVALLTTTRPMRSMPMLATASPGTRIRPRRPSAWSRAAGRARVCG